MAIEKALAQLEVNSEAPDVVADLGAYYSDTDNTTQALIYIKRALALTSDNLRVRQRPVSTYEKLDIREQAFGWIDGSMLSDIESQPELSKLVEDPRYLDS